jgi:hypothetical protein
MEQNSGKVFREENPMLIDINDLPLADLTILKFAVDARILTLKRNDPELRKEYLNVFFETALDNFTPWVEDDETYKIIESMQEDFVILFLNEVEDFSFMNFFHVKNGINTDYARLSWLWKEHSISQLYSEDDTRFYSETLRISDPDLEKLITIPSQQEMVTSYQKYKAGEEKKDVFKENLKIFISEQIFGEHFLSFLEQDFIWITHC